MGKTKRHSIDPEYIKKKIRRLQRKLEHQEETSTSPQRSTSPEPITLPPPPPSQQPTQPLPPTQPPPSITNPEQGTSTEGNIEQIPEEFLAALGNEGEEKVEEGEPIQSELATRWMRIMAEGLTKEQIQTLVKKYPTPKNFPAAVAPILNKEIGATLSELSLNRDRRIINRQNMIAKILSCLGMTLTDILKGNINSKKLIEQISDAAKIAAEIHCNDSKSRKFFALSSATKIVQDACKETKTGKLLFGDGLSDQLKTVHIQTFKLERPIALPDNQPKGPRWAETYEASYYQPDTSPPCTNSGETNITESQPATLLDQKSNLIPAQSCKYLGFILNSNNLSLSVPQEKQLKIREKINSFKNKSTCKIRDFAQILGLLNSLCPAIPYGWLYTKILEREKYLALLDSDGNYDNKMSLSTMIFQELDWWLDNINKHNLTKTFNFKIEIHTDASNSGWGAVCGTETASGSWSATEKNYHINYLELKAALLGLQCFTSNIHDCEVLLRVDNTTAVAYINKMGGIQFPHLNDVTRQLWKWCESRNIWIYASYVNTKDNIADAESRKINIEWELSKDAYQIIITTFGVPSIDLFASRINTKCKKFISWKRDPEAFAEKPPAAQTTYPGCRAAIGEAYIKRGVPAASVNVMLSSLTTNTYKQYDVALKLWWQFCNKYSINPYKKSVTSVLKFLTERFQNSASYGTINSARSALSLLLGPDIGRDDSIKRLMKGVFKSKPPKPKYDFTWDPAIVLNHLTYPNNNISLERLTKKLVTVLALTTGHRIQTLSLITINNIKFQNNTVKIYIPDFIKTSKPGVSQPTLLLESFQEKIEICPVTILESYINITGPLRGNVNRLIITFKKPYRPASVQTISRWIKTTIGEAGIDTSMFTAYSTRHASTSAAKRSGISIELIRKTAGWTSSSSTFARFYNRPLIEDSTFFSSAICNSINN
ncbi:hypothetical protein MSG28_004882 [Choristoneura fumiferana]|uniref:Uncharacterized protein n=1 Tax=Choristoneura fumiferana TaxID=7141 RepID=A0ACC0K7W3_CHOFU|nr:hypothetical protein MSG28_004882 [Choristoneura fumiferana]